MEIEKVVEQKFSEIVSSGFIEEQVKKHLEETVASTIRECLRTYSDFGKSLEKNMKEALGIGNMKFDFPSYNQIVLTWVKEIINRQIIDIGKAQIEKNLEEFFKPLEKSEWKISEIIEKFMEGLAEDGESGEITYISEDAHGDGYVDYYFDKDADTHKYSCAYRLRVNKDGVWAATIDGDDSAKMKTPLMYGFDAFMFQLFATKAKVINDSDHVDTYYGNDE